MARARGKETIVFRFVNWPEKEVPKALSERSAEVVDGFIASLDQDSTARVASLEIEADGITLVRRKRAARVEGRFAVVLNVAGSKTTEKDLRKTLCDKTYREYLRQMVDAASGASEFDTGFAARMIANAAFTRSIGFFERD